ncbi:metal ABC transporter permease [Candidatus Bipolaricaulota bacterium]|nr:metal ABC transporter permease [Candidatus Bipolaricaulota bacterium]
MWALIFPSLVAGALAGASGGLLGVVALRLRLSALGYAMAHAAFAGAALGLWLGLPPLLMAFLFAAAVAALLGPISEKTGLPADTILAILFPLTMAIGFLFIALTPGLALTSPALTLLWGSLLGVGWNDVFLLAGIFFAAAGFLVFFRREVWATLVERRLAEEAGIPTRWILWPLLFLLGGGVAGSLRLVGGLLVYVMLFLPASSAAQLVLDLRRQFFLAPVLGVVSTLGGVGLSFWADLPVGTAVAVSACAVFLLSWIISPRRRISLTPPTPH